MKKIIAALALLLTACAAPTGQAPDHSHQHTGEHLAAHYKDSIFKVSEQKKYSVELRLKEGKFYTGANSLDLIIHKDVEKNQDMENARVTITPWMPAMGHGVHIEPVIKERGRGLYSAENVVASMRGGWELRIEIDGDLGKDRVVFDFPNVGAPEQHKDMHGKHGGRMENMGISRPPAGTDLSASRMSAGGYFKGTFSSRINPVPLNRIHAWEFTLTNHRGVPVAGATVSVEGNMPQHGHGLPTQPRVTKKIKDGVFLVKGMKFNMPGWWTITFKVNYGSVEDTVTFNLDVR